MASSRLLHLQERQGALLQALISKIFDFQEPNFRTAHDFCTYNLSPKHHSFLSAHPAKVEQLYAGLEERLDEHAQFSKADALRRCRHRLLQLGLQGADPDLDWSILSLLFSLSHRPLDTPAIPPPPTAQRQRRHRLQAPRGPAGPPADHDPGASSPPESDPGEDAWADSASELSDWSDADQDSARVQGSPCGRPMHDPGDDASASALDSSTEPNRSQGQPTDLVSAWASLAAAAATARASASASGDPSLPSPPTPSIGPPRQAPRSPADLVALLSQARLGLGAQATTFAHPSASPHCCSVGYIAHQALSLLLGSPSAAFEWQERMGRYQPRRGLHVPHVSPTQLQAVLTRLAAAGTQARHLWAMASLAPGAEVLQLPATMCSVGFHSPRVSPRKTVLATPCLRAFLTALAAQLRRLSRPLVALQQLNLHGASACSSISTSSSSLGMEEGASSPARRPLTLLELLDLTDAASRRLQLLYSSALAVVAALPAVTQPANAAASPAPSPRSPAGAGGARPQAAAGGVAPARSPSGSRLAPASPTGAGGWGTNSRASADGGREAASGGGARAAGRPHPSVPTLRLDEAAPAPAAPPPGPGGNGSSAEAAPPPGAAARASSILVDTLHQQLMQFGVLGGPAQCSDHQVLLHLYLCTLSPLLEGLQSWLCNSDCQEDDLPTDFFIQPADRKVSETDPAYWSTAYELVLQQAESAGGTSSSSSSSAGGEAAAAVGAGAGRPEGAAAAAAAARPGSGQGAQVQEQAAAAAACPSFLQPLAAGILAAGKSLRLLKSSDKSSGAPGMQGTSGRRAAATPGRQLPHGSPLRAYMAPRTGRKAGASGTNDWGGSGRDSSLCHAFLSVIMANLSGGPTNSDGPQQQQQQRQQQALALAAPATASADGPAVALTVVHSQEQAASQAETAAASPSYFALMAEAGRSLSRLEPWWSRPCGSSSAAAASNSASSWFLDSSSQALAPSPHLPWTPPWTSPSDASPSGSMEGAASFASTAAAGWGHGNRDGGDIRPLLDQMGVVGGGEGDGAKGPQAGYPESSPRFWQTMPSNAAPRQPAGPGLLGPPSASAGLGVPPQQPESVGVEEGSVAEQGPAQAEGEHRGEGGMDTSEPPTPSDGRPQQGPGGDVEMGEAGGGLGVSGRATEADAGTLGGGGVEGQRVGKEEIEMQGAVPGLEAWHAMVTSGMAAGGQGLLLLGTSGRRRGGGMSSAGLQVGGGGGAGQGVRSRGGGGGRAGGGDMEQLRASLLPSPWHPVRPQQGQRQGQQPARSLWPWPADGASSWWGGAAATPPHASAGRACGAAAPAPPAADVPAQQQALTQLSWLLEGADSAPSSHGSGQLPSVDLLLQRCLLPLLHDRVSAINGRLLACLLSDWGLQAELTQLRNFYLLSSPAMQAWAARLLGALLRGKMVEELQEHELEAMLQEAVNSSPASDDASAGGGTYALPPLDSVSITVDAKRAARARDKQVEATKKTAASFSSAAPTTTGQGGHLSERQQNHCLAELEGLQLRCQPTWLLAMIGGNQAMDSYGQAQVFLLQIQLAKLALEKMRQRSWKLFQANVRRRRSPATAGTGPGADAAAAELPGVLDVMYGLVALPRQQQRPGGGAAAGAQGGGSSAALLGPKAEEAAQQEMVNFVNNLHQFVLDRLLLNAWVQLERGLETARSLDEVAALHRRFVAELDQQCGRGAAGGGTQKHIWAAIIRVLDQVVRFCSAHKNAAEAAEALVETAARAAGEQQQQQQSAGGQQLAGPGGGQGQGLPGRRGGAGGGGGGGLLTRPQLQLQEQLDTARKVAADAASQFRQLLLYLLRVLHAATLRARARVEFEALLTRVNHNGYYDAQLQLGAE